MASWILESKASFSLNFTRLLAHVLKKTWSVLSSSEALPRKLIRKI